jgi:hypothetical protein
MTMVATRVLTPSNIIYLPSHLQKNHQHAQQQTDSFANSGASEQTAADGTAGRSHKPAHLW